MLINVFEINRGSGAKKTKQKGTSVDSSSERNGDGYFLKKCIAPNVLFSFYFVVAFAFFVTRLEETFVFPWNKLLTLALVFVLTSLVKTRF